MIAIDKNTTISRFLRTIIENGRYVFTLKEAQSELGTSLAAVRATLRRLKNKKAITRPVRGFYVIVPDEYMSVGSLPAEQFLPELMKYIGKPYYVGLLTAARYHGAAHQASQEFQVVTSSNRKPILSGRVKIKFIAKNRVENSAVDKIKTPNGFLNVSSPEMTALDLIMFPEHSGGLNNVATVLSELEEKINPQKLIVTAKQAPAVAYVQRLGFILEFVLKKKKLATSILPFVKKNAHSLIRLSPSLNCKGARLNERWKILINTKIEPDL